MSLENLMSLHRAAAHFPMALLITALLFRLAAEIWRRDDLRVSAGWVHRFGLVGGMATLLLGLMGNPFRSEVGWVGNPFTSYERGMVTMMVWHQWAGMGALLLFGAALHWERRRPWVYGVFCLAGAVTLIAAGYLGGHMME